MADILSTPQQLAILPNERYCVHRNRLLGLDHDELIRLHDRKWRRIHSLNIRYGKAPNFVEEALPTVLEGRMSSFIFTSRMKTLNQLLANERTLHDCTRVWQSVITIVFAFGVIFAISVMKGMSAVISIGLILFVFLVWLVVRIYFLVSHPQIELEVEALCKTWSRNDISQRVGYVSRRSVYLPRTSWRESLKNHFIPVETDWFIVIVESVRDEFSRGMSRLTVDSLGSCALPAYLPPWDSTPAPEYVSSCVDLDSVSIAPPDFRFSWSGATTPASPGNPRRNTLIL
ncbi:hypothetical protein HDU98_002118 [Podochytrium sp. JEL0797]|nr:hypothetical protein HDU98_002118 [Podochytrium sp. JEL0797]